jgi:glycosyltransferase involved in cell wall biosynthesis
VAADRLSILALEPYYDGSHRAVLDALVEHVDADWHLLTLPARKWKWRMRGSAMTFAEQAGCLAEGGSSGHRRFDLVFASTFLNLAEWRGLVGAPVASVPAIVYFHENQLVYPNRHSAEWDFQFPLTNITSALSAETCLFNTQWNLDGFLAEIPGFLKQFPDHQPKGVADRIAEKSRVLHPPFDPQVFDETPVERARRCRIVWPHRWEHDKNPEEFFSAVGVLAEEGLDFEVVVAGQAFKDVPEPILRAEELLGARLVHLGEPASRAEYARLLASSDVAVSTGVNEFFGIAMIEAAYAGCFPLVPERLAYPEIYPAEMRYQSAEQLVPRLRSLVASPPAPNLAREPSEPYTIEALVPRYADVFREVAFQR